MGEAMEKAVLITFVVMLMEIAHTNEIKQLGARELGESRRAVADLWTHTEGAPRGLAVDLHLPDGDSEAVAKMVADKKIQIAAAGLHHATVKMKQIQERKKTSDEEDESDITK